MYEALLVIYLIIAVVLIGFILIQQGKGANVGASFGGGASGTIFGSRGAGNFLSHTTAVLATIFFLISIALGNINSHHSAKNEGFNNLSQVAEQVQQQEQVAAKTQSNTDIPR